MPTSDTASAELLGELMAFRAAHLFLVKSLIATLAGMNEPTRSLAIEQIDAQFKVRRGELLYVTQPELAAELQAVCNAAMQSTLESLAAEVVQSLRSFTSAP